jgi:signal transduction histidine kinase
MCAREDPVALRARIRQLEDENIALQRLAQLGSRAAMIAHEFNNLMTPIMARAQLALQQGDAATTQKALDCAFAYSQKAIGITNSILGLTHPDADQPQHCDVASAVQQALDICVRPPDRDGITLQLDLPPGLTVAARPLMLEQVLLNLILNARAAMRGRSGLLAISSRREGAVVRIDVSDTGTGMPAAHIEHVVNPFLAADPLHDSGDWRDVGLGLNVCRTIARQHGASLRIRLNEGIGCTVELRWPAD